jgi:hypothetical protein
MRSQEMEIKTRRKRKQLKKDSKKQGMNEEKCNEKDSKKEYETLIQRTQMR